MAFIADILLIAGALGAGFYCIILSRRLTKFTDLEKGMGGAIAVLSVQVDDLTKLLQKAQTTAAGSSSSLEDLTGRAEGAAKRLELLVASLHDLPSKPQPESQPKLEVEAQPQQAVPLGSIFSSKRTRLQEAAE